MHESAGLIPFGLLYEELAPDRQQSIMPCYDEDMDLSYVANLDGCKIPYVEMCVMGTNTETKVRYEDTDTDPGQDHEAWLRIPAPLLGTETITEARTENTDKD